jgi:hypothetical protein
MTAGLLRARLHRLLPATLLRVAELVRVLRGLDPVLALRVKLQGLRELASLRGSAKSAKSELVAAETAFGSAMMAQLALARDEYAAAVAAREKSDREVEAVGLALEGLRKDCGRVADIATFCERTREKVYFF